MGKYDVFAVGALFLLAFWLWTLPIQASPIPFGEGDAAWQFTSGDQMYLQDRADYTIPKYLGYWYYGYNKVLGPHHNEYPPPYPLNIALAQLFGGDRFVSAYIMIAILSMSACMSTFLLVRKLYGLVPGFMAGFAMIFSIRDIMLYLWGQRGAIISFTFIPAVLYCYYMYMTSDSRQKKNIYLFATVAVLSSQYIFHIQGMAASIGSIILFTFFLWIKERKFPFTYKEIRENWKAIMIAAIAFLIVIVPFLVIYLGPGETHPIQFNNFSRLFSWFKVDDQPGYAQGNVEGYPIIFFSQSMIYHKWLLPLIFAGLAVLLLRRETKDLLVLAWAMSVYILIHLDVTGFLNVQRAARMLIAETALFYTLIAIGLVGIISFFKIGRNIAAILKYSICILFVLLIISNGKIVPQGPAVQAYGTLKNAYGGLLRINQFQIEAAYWIRDNLPEDALVIDKGTITYPKLRFMIPYSQHYITNHLKAMVEENIISVEQLYYMVDYSDLALLGQQSAADSLFEWEKQNFPNSTLVYNNNNIHIWHGNIKVFTNA